FAAAGFRDLTIAREVIGAGALGRVADLLADSVRVRFCVDTDAGAAMASQLFTARGLTAEVLVEVDTGHGRCGVRWDDLDAGPRRAALGVAGAARGRAAHARRAGLLRAAGRRDAGRGARPRDARGAGPAPDAGRPPRRRRPPPPRHRHPLSR